MDGKVDHSQLCSQYYQGRHPEGYPDLRSPRLPTQIVFEAIFASSDQKLEEGEHKYDLKFGGRTHVLYQHSYLGYSLMHARRHVHSLVDFMVSIRVQTPTEKKDGIIGRR